MDVLAVDERDSSWELDAPRFRVYFFDGDGPGHSTSTFDVTDADVLDVLRWAQAEAGDERMHAVALVCDELPRTGAAAGRGLVWLLGMDANSVPQDDVDRSCQAAMRLRRGQQVVLPNHG